MTVASAAVKMRDMEKPAVAKLEDIELLIAAEARIDTALSQLALTNLG